MQIFFYIKCILIMKIVITSVECKLVVAMLISSWDLIESSIRKQMIESE